MNRPIRWAVGLLMATTLAGCGENRALAPAPVATRKAADTAELERLRGDISRVSQRLGQLSRAEGGELAGSRERLTDALAAMRARVAQLQEAAATGHVSMGSSARTADDVDAAGVIDADWTDVSLTSGSSAVCSYTHVTVPAVLYHDVSGTATTGGVPYPISASTNSGLPNLLFYDEVPLPEVDCTSSPADVNAATFHQAGWSVKGIGLTLATDRTTDAQSCQPTDYKCSTATGDLTYDPYSGTCGGPGGGPGGSTCTYEYVQIETSNDGGVTWTVWWEGMATVCQ